MIRRYLSSTDHKHIGLLYGFTSLFFLLVGFVLVILIRWQVAYPGKPLPVIGGLLGEANAPGGILLPEFYNQLGAMHGTIMVFLGVVPLAFGAFGNYLLPLQIGAPDMAFPRLNLASYWFFFAGGVVMLYSFFVPFGAANNGWMTVAISSLQLPATPTVAFGLTIATAKAALVALFFMHLKGERAMVYWPLALTVFLFAALLAFILWSEATHIVGTQQ